MINSKMIHRFCLSISLVLFLSVSQAETVTPPLNFDFQSIQVSSALQLLADYRGLNLVLDDSIHGSLSMRMKDVTWDEAIEYVSSAKGLLYSVEGNFLRVSSLQRPSEYSKQSYGVFQQLKDSSSSAANSSFRVSIFKVHNILSSDAIKAFALDQGESLNFEDDSSIIVARMSDSRLSDFRTYLAAVDYSRKQVMIEARIVEVDRSYSKNLGVQWGGSVGSGAGTVTGSVPLGLSAAAVAGFGIVSKSVNLDVALSAMEQRGKGRVISSPRVYTSDRHKNRMAARTLRMPAGERNSEIRLPVSNG